MARRLLFAVHDWGLGHATRSLLLIRALIERGDHVTVLSAPGDGLRLLQAELGGSCRFLAYRDIPKPFSRWPAMFYLRMSLDMPRVLARFKLEHHFAERLVARDHYEGIISDSRFGLWSRAVPSYCILHSLRQIIPGRPRWMERFVEHGQRRLTAGFTRILIPDVATDGGLSGELGHAPRVNWGHDRLHYIGPLSGVRRRGDEADIDVFFSISGIEPQRGRMTRKVLDALPKLPGRIVATLGQPGGNGHCRHVGSADVYDYLDRQAQEEMLNRARIVVTRSGYTTLMELAELGKKALFVPTPGQSEQEYLGRFHHAKQHAWTVQQGQLNLARDLPRAATTQGMPQVSSKDSVARFLAAIDG